MRIGLIAPFGSPVRGVSPYADSLLSSLIKQSGLRVTPVNFEKLYPAFLYPGGAGTQADFKNGLHYANLVSWRRTARFVQDLVHFQYWSIFHLPVYHYLSTIYQRNNIKRVVTVHNPSQHEAMTIFDSFQISLLKSFDAIIVHTVEGKNILVDRGIPDGRIAVIPHGTEIRPDAIKPAAETSKTLLFFGNIRKYKGLEILLMAWDQLADYYPDYHLVVAGSLWQGKNILSRTVAKLLGSHQLAFRIQEYQELGWPKNTRYQLRFIAENELKELFNKAQFAAFPYTQFTAQSGAVLKAAAMGLPVLVSNAGGLSEIAINEAFICKENTPEDWAVLLKNRIDSYSNSMRGEQIARIATIAWDRVAELHKALYQSIV